MPSRTADAERSDTDTTNGFASLGLDERILAALTKLGYEEPTPVQREAIPPLLAGRDLLGQAATGTGKTAAFALPVLQRMPAGERPAQPAALVLALTRGVDVVVATPGRALDHIRRGTLRLGGVRTVVLDEADEMLDMGFAEDIETILAETPEGRQTA